MTESVNARLVEAAKAVVSRWHSPAWKWGDPHTGVLVDALGAAVAEAEAEAPKPVNARLVEALRPRFEDWCSKRWGGDRGALVRRDMPGSERFGEYANSQVEFVWRAWCAALAEAEVQAVPVALPDPDMTMPSIAPDGDDGAHFYRASTVRRLLAAAPEARVSPVNDKPACLSKISESDRQEAPAASGREQMMRPTPYEPTEAMRWAAKSIDLALTHDSIRALWSAMWAAAPEAPAPEPIDMVLHCPKCGKQHIDEPHYEKYVGPLMAETVFAGAWDNPPHRSHLCHGCGHIWRPADIPTNGVESVKTKGKADSEIVSSAPAPAVAWMWRNTKTGARGVYFDDPAQVFESLTDGDYEWAKLCIHPPAQREPLTRADIDDLLQDHAQGSEEMHDFARNIERMLAERWGVALTHQIGGK